MAVERGNGSLRRMRIIASNRPQRPVFPVLHPLKYAKWKLWQSAVKHSLNEVKRNYPQHAREVEEYLHGYQENGEFHPGIVKRLSAEDKETRTHAVAEMKRLFARADLGRAASTTWPFMTPGERHLASDAKTTLGKFSRMPGLAKRLVIYTLAAAQIVHMAPSAAVTTREALQNWLAKKPAIEAPQTPGKEQTRKPQAPKQMSIEERADLLRNKLYNEFKKNPELLEPTYASVNKTLISIHLIGVNAEEIKALTRGETPQSVKMGEDTLNVLSRVNVKPDPNAHPNSIQYRLWKIQTYTNALKLAAKTLKTPENVDAIVSTLDDSQKQSMEAAKRQGDTYKGLIERSK